MTQKTIKQIILIASTVLLSFSNAQITFNALEKMKQPFSFKQQSIIARLIATQQKQINDGVIKEFESRCISSNIVVMFGDENAERFAAIAEKAYAHQIDSLSIEEVNFMQTINDKYMSALAIIADECSQESPKKEYE